MDFAARLQGPAGIEERIAAACRQAGRERGDVALVAVSKEQPDDAIRAFHALGVRDFGENKVQALAGRIERLADLAGLRWHAIGPVQSNKAKDIARLRPALVHTIDRAELVHALARRLETAAGPLPCLIQVNVDREPQKAGVLPESVGALADLVAATPTLECHGLMAIPRPLDEVGADALARSFEGMRALLEDVSDRLAPGPRVLSMGMSDDFELAISHGATLVRVGTALFGPRSQARLEGGPP